MNELYAKASKPAKNAVYRINEIFSLKRWQLTGFYRHVNFSGKLKIGYNQKALSSPPITAL